MTRKDQAMCSIPTCNTFFSNAGLRAVSLFCSNGPNSCTPQFLLRSQQDFFFFHMYSRSMVGHVQISNTTCFNTNINNPRSRLVLLILLQSGREINTAFDCLLTRSSLRLHSEDPPTRGRRRKPSIPCFHAILPIVMILILY